MPLYCSTPSTFSADRIAHHGIVLLEPDYWLTVADYSTNTSFTVTTSGEPPTPRCDCMYPTIVYLLTHHLTRALIHTFLTHHSKHSAYEHTSNTHLLTHTLLPPTPLPTTDIYITPNDINTESFYRNLEKDFYRNLEKEIEGIDDVMVHIDYDGVLKDGAVNPYDPSK